MIEFAKLIHTALRTDSTPLVVLALAILGAVIFGSVGLLVNLAYISGLPKVSIELTGVNISVAGPPLEGQGSLVVLLANVTNTGSQSAIKKWDLFIELPNHASVHATPIDSPVVTLQGQRRMIFRVEDALYRKAFNPIGPGQVVAGYLPFLIKDVSQASLLSTNVRFRLVVVDAFGKTYMSEKPRALFIDELSFIPFSTN